MRVIWGNSLKKLRSAQDKLVLEQHKLKSKTAALESLFGALETSCQHSDKLIENISKDTKLDAQGVNIDIKELKNDVRSMSVDIKELRNRLSAVEGCNSDEPAVSTSAASDQPASSKPSKKRKIDTQEQKSPTLEPQATDEDGETSRGRRWELLW